MASLGPKALVDLFAGKAHADIVGGLKVMLTSEAPTRPWAYITKIWLGDLFRALDSPVLLVSLDSALALSMPSRYVTQALDEIFLANAVAGEAFAIILATATTRSKTIAGLIKNTAFASHLRPISAGALETAARKADPAAAIRQVVLERTPLHLLNPYGSGKKPSDSMFFGRQSLRDEIKKSGDHLCIVGPRRIGKSSLMQKIQRELGTIPLNNKEVINCVSYVDISTLHTPNGQLFVEILKGFDLKPGQMRSLAKLRQLVGSKFAQHVDLEEGAVLGTLITRYPNKLVIILDEIDNWLIEAATNSTALLSLNRLRALTDDKRARVFLVGYEYLMSAMKKPEFPFSGRAREIFLDGLDRGNVNRLVTEPLQELAVAIDPSNDVLQRIWLASSGRPNIVQELCCESLRSRSIDSLRKRAISPALIDSIIHQNALCGGINDTVRYLKYPLAKLIAVSALMCESEFRRKDVIDKFDKGFEFKIDDFELSFEILKVRCVLENTPQVKSTWRWVNDRVWSGVSEYVKDYSLAKISQECMQEYCKGDWRKSLWT